MGWGLVGLCPGPAIVDVGFLDGHAALFVLSMVAGMGLYATLAAAMARPAGKLAIDDG